MVVVFVDGVDGAGKTTLLDLLAARLGPQTRVAPPLWRYLPSIANAEDFAGWVTTSDSAQVASELLTAQRDRIATIPAAAHDPEELTVLVDRGPKTVEASSRAHLGAAQGSAAAEVQRGVADLREVVRQVTAVSPCLSVELTVESYGQIIGRLTVDEQNDPVYVEYLHRFLRQFQRIDDNNGVLRLVLTATDTLDRNLAAAARTIDCMHSAG